MTAWFLRAVRWAKNPPSAKQVILVLSIIAFALAIAGIEALGLWPESLTVDRPAHRPPKF